MKRKYLSTAGARLSDVPFGRRVVLIALSIPFGKVTTYGRIAHAAGGGSMASQSITHILSRAEQHGVTSIPYHRIVYADGRIWVPAHCAEKRMKQYAREGIHITEAGRVADFEAKLYDVAPMKAALKRALEKEGS